MKTNKEKRIEAHRRQVHVIWKALKIEQVIKQFGYAETKSAISRWLTAQVKTNALRRKQAELEAQLKEIEEKL